jgi:hypothetical protein
MPSQGKRVRRQGGSGRLVHPWPRTSKEERGQKATTRPTRHPRVIGDTVIPPMELLYAMEDLLAIVDTVRTETERLSRPVDGNQDQGAEGGAGAGSASTNWDSSTGPAP